MTALLRPLLAAAVFTLLGGSPAHCGEPSFSLTISLAQDTAKAGSEVTVKIVLKNITDHEIRIGGIRRTLPADDVVPANCRAIVTDAKGAPAPYTKYGERMWSHPLEEGVNGTGIFGPMEAGGQGAFDLVLSRLYDLSKPGKYTIEVKYPDYDNEVIVRSNKIVLTITE
jgi:hypothetical protein